MLTMLVSLFLKALHILCLFLSKPLVIVVVLTPKASSYFLQSGSGMTTPGCTGVKSGGQVPDLFLVKQEGGFDSTQGGSRASRSSSSRAAGLESVGLFALNSKKAAGVASLPATAQSLPKYDRWGRTLDVAVSYSLSFTVIKTMMLI